MIRWGEKRRRLDDIRIPRWMWGYMGRYGAIWGVMGFMKSKSSTRCSWCIGVCDKRIWWIDKQLVKANLLLAQKTALPTDS